MASLDVYMNEYYVGIFTKKSSGAHSFQYTEDWVNQPGSRPISLSMPLQLQEYQGDCVYNFFDNLLPDNTEIRNRIVSRYNANSSQPFDLLAAIGADTVGALRLLPSGSTPANIKKIEYHKLDDTELEKILLGYQSNTPLGMLEEYPDFRISIAGAQEKTALLLKDDHWCVPHNNTPTTHIIKLPIGVIEGHSYTMDLSDSVENEYLCTLIAKEFDLPVPHCSIIKTKNIKALAVERFDRKYSSDKSWIIRLPQEDFCQILNIPSALKYENEGGPGIIDIMKYLLSSSNADQDRFHFMKAQVLFWLLAAIDGHAKNFSVFINQEGRFHLTPLYDIMSIYPNLGGRGLNPRDAKLAMGLKASRGKKYAIEQIFPRHFYQTAEAVGFDPSLMSNILRYFYQEMDDVIQRVKQQLPEDFPSEISNTILDGMKARVVRLANI
ncbi:MULTISPECIES: type II toxin-antitoxin system HipA family toxin [Proteus]|uniref:Serine/threonine-protein kinase HipA n=1 Tax=Proteus penneri TaxID=102862 RepID=A0A0G4QFT4_9GAMM|nr:MULTISPECIES: type II toxin-antitoxin system HipA family toxin [Proteus]NBM48179.1 type II toxin-antitoxin system HipA family toxin [Proteus sp. G2666]CRL64625.1 Serine/threonine-protein kinase HipA [Proteus penneri]